MLNKWLSGYHCIRVRHDVRNGRKVITLRILNSVRSKNSKPWGIKVNPFVPSNSPAIIVNKYLVVTLLHYLCLQPLVNSVLGINPHSNLKLPILQLKLFTICIIPWVLCRMVMNCTSSISEPSALGHVESILRSNWVAIANFWVHQALDILGCATQHIKRFSLVEAHLLKVRPCILLEDQPPVAP